MHLIGASAYANDTCSSLVYTGELFVFISKFQNVENNSSVVNYRQIVIIVVIGIVLFVISRMNTSKVPYALTEFCYEKCKKQMVETEAEKRYYNIETEALSASVTFQQCIDECVE